MAATSLRSRTKVRLNAIISVWSTSLSRMDGSSPRERPKLDHMAGLTGEGVPNWADPSQVERGRGPRGGPGGPPRVPLIPPLPPRGQARRGCAGRLATRDTKAGRDTLPQEGGTRARGAEAEAAGAEGGSGTTARPARAEAASARSRSKSRIRVSARMSLPYGRRASPSPSWRTKVPSSSSALAQRKTPRGPPIHDSRFAGACSSMSQRSLSPASRRGWADGSAEHKRSGVRSEKADRIAICKRQRCP